MASGSGHHLILPRGFPCSLQFGVAEVTRFAALVTHSALVSCPLSWGNLGVHMTERPTCTWPWPPWERGSYACTPTCPRRPQARRGLAGGLLGSSDVPGLPGWHAASSLEARCWGSEVAGLWVLRWGGVPWPGLYWEWPGPREAAFIFVSGPYGINRRNTIFVTKHECKSHRLSNKAPETSPYESNTICTTTTCIHHKLHHEN